MSMVTSMNEHDSAGQDKPGAQLAAKRQDLGYSVEYVANKLHLRVRMLELLESDQYDLMPQPVFIQGYLRGYAKLLDLDPEPLIATYKQCHTFEKKLDKALWQSRRAPARAEHAIRWGTFGFALMVLALVFFWWQNNKDNERVFSQHMAQAKPTQDVAHHDIRLTDLSKMRSLLAAQANPGVEKESV